MAVNEHDEAAYRARADLRNLLTILLGLTDDMDEQEGGDTHINGHTVLFVRDMAKRNGQNLPIQEADARRGALNVILGASELVGAHGLHLTWREVEEMPDDVRQALRALGVTDEEMAASDAEAAAEEKRMRS